MMAKNLYRLLMLPLLLMSTSPILALWPTNLFDPYDILLMKPVARDAWAQIDVTYEGAFKIKAYQAVEETTGHTKARKQNNILELWQDRQNIFGAFTNVAPDCYVQPPADAEFNIPPAGACQNPTINLDAASREFENTHHSNWARVEADLKIPVNLMMAARFPVTCDWTFGLYLPFYVVELSHVSWKNEHVAGTDNQDIHQQLKLIEKTADIDVHNGWKRQGVGDFTALMMWFHDFYQNKLWLKDVLVGLRGGLIFPTGLAADNEKLFALPFGHDGGLGILFGGTLDLDIMHWMRFGIDAEFKHFFGSKHERRFLTDSRQTDLIFLNKALTFREPGFTQHYTIYLKSTELFRFLTFTLAYQNTNHQEDSITLLNSKFNSREATRAENLQDWATHNLIGMVDFDFRALPHCTYIPAISFFAKYGFRGHRALVCDTAGIQISMDF